jgi:AraC-like DNA-binding protein
MTGMASTAHVAPVVTVIHPRERMEVDRAGVGFYRTMHRDSVKDLLRDLRHRRVSAVVLSPDRCIGAELPRTMRVVREFPRIPALVLLTPQCPASATDVLMMGSCGVRHVVDVRAPGGWGVLREAIAATTESDPEEHAVRQVLTDIGTLHPDMERFVRALFSGYDAPRTVRRLAASLGVLATTMVSRFHRAGLPAPKRYLATAGLVRAARLLENPGLSIADVANHLNHSSPQSFARHIRTFVGVPAGEFRRRHTWETMLLLFRERLIIPHAARLRTLAPALQRPRLVTPGGQPVVSSAAVTSERTGTPVS